MRKPSPGTPIVASSLSAGLAAYWTLAEGAGTTVRGLPGPAKDGTLVGAPAWASGPRGPVLSFAGGATADAVAYPDAGLPAGDAPVTVMAWLLGASVAAPINAVRFGSAAADGEQVSIGQQDDGAGPVAIVSVGGAGGDVYGTARIDDGAWHQLAAAYDGSAWHLYVDGSLVASGTPAVAKDTALTGTGYISDGRPTYGWRGLVDSAAIWGRALAASEVAALAANPLALFGNLSPARGRWFRGLGRRFR